MATTRSQTPKVENRIVVRFISAVLKTTVPNKHIWPHRYFIWTNPGPQKPLLKGKNNCYDHSHPGKLRHQGSSRFDQGMRCRSRKRKWVSWFLLVSRSNRTRPASWPAWMYIPQCLWFPYWQGPVIPWLKTLSPLAMQPSPSGSRPLATSARRIPDSREADIP